MIEQLLQWIRRRVFRYGYPKLSRREVEEYLTRALSRIMELEHDQKLAILNGWWIKNHPLSAHIQVTKSRFGPRARQLIVHGEVGTKMLGDGTIQPL